MPGRHEQHGDRQQRGIPDGVLVGLLAFVLGLTVLVWSATGLAGLFAHGNWPQAVTFGRTPVALRQLVARPHDLPAAWPDTPAGELSGYGLFWGLLISQLMILTVLGVFVLGVTARWRAGRARRRAQLRNERGRGPTPVSTPARDSELPSSHKTSRQERPSETMRSVTLPAPRLAPQVRYGDPGTRRPAAVQAIQDAEGPALVITSDPSLWTETKDARAKLGPVLVYDPGHLCDTPARLHWSPTAGCEDPDTAAARAAALLTPVRPHALLDAAMADTAETLLRCWLHAAAVDARPFKQVHRWAQGGNSREVVRILRTHPRATPGTAGLLESALTGHPERREIAEQLAARTLSALSSIHIRDSCTANRTDSLTLESFVTEGGTLYVVGEAIEDPRSHPGAMPLLTALASSVVEHGRRMAARSPDGRLDPPLTLILDDVAAVAPLPLLPELLATGENLGLPTLALLRSREQGRDRWPRHQLPFQEA